MTSLEALMLLLQHYPASKGEGIEASALNALEEELGGMVSLGVDDFETVPDKWQSSGHQPSVADFIDSLRAQCAVNLKARSH